MADERSRYRRYREDIWMLQVRDKGSDQIWCVTGSRWFSRKSEGVEYMREHAIPQWPHLEYRVVRYRPVK